MCSWQSWIWWGPSSTCSPRASTPRPTPFAGSSSTWPGSPKCSAASSSRSTRLFRATPCPPTSTRVGKFNFVFPANSLLSQCLKSCLGLDWCGDVPIPGCHYSKRWSRRFSARRPWFTMESNVQLRLTLTWQATSSRRQVPASLSLPVVLP